MSAGDCAGSRDVKVAAKICRKSSRFHQKARIFDELEFPKNAKNRRKTFAEIRRRVKFL
jgi:hypothetical protein